METGPLATALANRFSARVVCTLGGVLLGLAVILSSLAPSIEYMFISHSALTGLGGALVYAPAIVIVGQYFDKKRSLALGISTAGSGLGIFGFAPLIELLLEHYGYFGGLLITGAIMLNACVSGCLYRPLPVKQVRVYEEEPIITESGYFIAQEDHNVRDAPSSKPAEDVDFNVSSKLANHKQRYEETEEVSGQRNKASKYRLKLCAGLKRYFNLGILRNGSFLLFVIGTALANCASQLPLMFITDHVEDQGLGRDLSVLIISAAGIADTAGRVLSGILMDLRMLVPRRRHIYIFAYILLGVVCAGFGFSRTFPAFIGLSLVYGASLGVTTGQRVVLAADIVGVEALPDAVAVLMFAQGVSLPIGSLLTGYIKDVSGSYLGSYLLTGTGSVVAGLCLIAGYVIEKRRS